MDAVSRLIRMARLEGAVDVRCLLAGRFTLDNPASGPGEIPFHLLLEGHCTIHAAGRVLHLRPGDLVLFPRGGAHRVVADTDVRTADAVEEPGVAFPTLRTPGTAAEIDLFCGHYKLAPGAGALLFQTLPDPLHVSFGDDTSAPALSTLMRLEAHTERPGTAAIVSSLCDALLAMALRGSPLPGEPLWTATTDTAVLNAIGAVLHDPSRLWTIAEFSRQASMSRATFIRHFTRATRLPVGEFVTKLRMMIAADQLVGGDRPINSIATAVGYRSESAFGRAFRLATGTTPARFRATTLGRSAQ
jgi:AraC family transcriptional activator of mtrCDE